MASTQMGTFDSATGAYSAYPANQRHSAAHTHNRQVTRPAPSQIHQTGTYPTNLLTETMVNPPTPAGHLAPHLYGYNDGIALNYGKRSRAKSGVGSQNVPRLPRNAGGFSQQRCIQPMSPSSGNLSRSQQLQTLRQNSGQFQRQQPDTSMFNKPTSASHVSGSRSVLGKRRYDPSEDVNEDPNKESMRQVKRHQAISGQYPALENAASARRVYPPVRNRQMRQQFVHNGGPQTCGFDSAKEYGSQAANPAQLRHSYPGSGFQVGRHLLPASQPSSAQPANQEIHRNAPREGPNDPATVSVSLRLTPGTRMLLLRPGDQYAITSTVTSRGAAGWEKVDRSSIDIGLANRPKQAQRENGGDVFRQTNPFFANSPNRANVLSEPYYGSGEIGDCLGLQGGAAGNTHESPIVICEDDTAGPELSHDFKGIHRQAAIATTPTARPCRQAEGISEKIEPQRQLNAPEQRSEGLLQDSRPYAHDAIEHEVVNRQPTICPRVADTRNTTSAQEQPLLRTDTVKGPQYIPTDEASSSTLLLPEDFELQPLEGGFEEFLNWNLEFTDGSQQPIGNLEMDADLPSACLDLDERLFDGLLEELGPDAIQGCRSSGFNGEAPPPDRAEEARVVSSEFLGIQKAPTSTEAAPVEQKAEQDNTLGNGDKEPDLTHQLVQATPVQQTVKEKGSLDYQCEDGDEVPDLTNQPVQSSPVQQASEEDPLAYLFEDEDEEAVLNDLPE